MSQIGFEYGPILLEGVHAGALAKHVLQLLDERAHAVRGADRASGYVA